MKTAKYFMIIFFAVCLAAPSVALAGNGYMGGKGEVVADEPPADTGGDGGIPDGVGPNNDKMSDQGKLYGDLYVIQRYRGDETRLIPEVNADGEPVLGSDDVQALVEGPPAIGGEPVLTEDYGIHTATDDDGNVIVSEGPDGGVVLFSAPYPSQCVQPLASYDRWGAIDSKTDFDDNRLPMVAIYDSTWFRTECEVGTIQEVKIIDGEEGQEAEIVVGGYFIEPGGEWPDPLGIDAVYPLGVLWTDLIQEVSFGRLNLGRAPAAVLDHAFDEAVRSINSAIAIDIDPAGRLLLTREVYDEFMVDSDGNPLRDEDGNLLYGEIVTKAIDSPLENLALYVKLIQDGHLITPASDRTPIDRSIRGGVPIWKLLEMEDGPSDALRPTIDIEHFDDVADPGLSDLLGHLVDASAVGDYFTYWLVTYVDEGVAESRELGYDSGTCEDDFDADILSSCKDGKLKNCFLANGCEDWYGVLEATKETAGEDFVFSAAFLSAAGDKTGQVNVDKVVYLNSILDINKVVGYSAYNDDGTPAANAIDYTKNPVYFDFDTFSTYDRAVLFNSRGENKNGKVKVLVWASEDSEGLSTWDESWESINDNVWFEDLGRTATGTPFTEIENIHGFAQMADDNLSVIEYIHTYQVPAGR